MSRKRCKNMKGSHGSTSQKIMPWCQGGKQEAAKKHQRISVDNIPQPQEPDTVIQHTEKY